MLKDYFLHICVGLMLAPFIVSLLFLLFGLLKARNAAKSGRRVKKEAPLDEAVAENGNHLGRKI
jgi:hypothetical protein